MTAHAPQPFKMHSVMNLTTGLCGQDRTSTTSSAFSCPICLTRGTMSTESFCRTWT